MIKGRRIITSIMLVLAIVCMSGCKKTPKAATFTYEENDAGNIVITGLTDKGRADAKIIVPATIDGKQVEGIGSGVFRDDTTVTEVVISDGISYIAENVFLSCYNLKTIEIPASVNSVGTNAFTDTQWEYDQLADKDELIVNEVLCKVKKESGIYNIPDGVKKIASGVFYNKEGITAINIPDSIEEIGAYAFAGCKGLAEVKLPSGVKRIEYGAFSDMNISEIIVPKSVEYIGNEAFEGIENVIKQ